MNKLKKALAVVLTICLGLAVVPGFAAAAEEEEEIMDVLIAAPTAAAPATRAQAVAELYALEGEPAFMNANVFDDVPAGSEAEAAIVWASGKGIVNGYGGGVFGPEDGVTREQLVTILWRYAQYKELDVSVGEDTNILSYNDAMEISSYAVAAFQWACGENIATDENGDLRPAEVLTAEEVSSLLDRFAYIYGLMSTASSGFAGGWTVNPYVEAADMPEGAREALDLALEGLVGVNVQPIACLGTQVVAGTNYAFLCKVRAISPTAEDRLVVYIVYRDLSGNATILEARDIAITDYTEASDISFPEAGMAGGWTIRTEGTALLTRKAEAAFAEATAGLVGVGYSPVALLGTQVVAGTNYAFLCAATRVTAQPSTALAVVIVNEAIGGEATVLSIANFSIR